MNKDSNMATRFGVLAESFKSLSAKSMALSLALFLGACATTGDQSIGDQSIVDQSTDDQSAEIDTADESKVDTQSKSVPDEPAPTAAELMKTLRAPLVEPKPAKAQAKTSQPEATPIKEAAAKVGQKAPDKTHDTAEKTAEKAETAKAVTKNSVNKELEQKTAAVSATVTKAEPAPVARKSDEAVVQKVPQQKVSQAVEEFETPPVSTALTNVKAFSVNTRQLPFTYDIWTIRKGNTTLTEGLVITTPTWEMGKEGYMSQIWLTLMEDKIHVNSSSDIEPATKGMGIRIDGGDLIPFSSIAETNIGVIEGRWLDRLALANKVDIYLGFFPGKKPTSDTFNSDLSLDNLARIVATYRILNQ